MHAHDNDIFNPTLLHQIVRLFRVGNGIVIGDVQRINFMGPGASLLALRQVIAAAIGIINGQGRFGRTIFSGHVMQGNFGRGFWASFRWG